MPAYKPADRPTMYFIGVTTAKSSINRVFPLWAKALGLGECQLRGIDFKLHDEPARYREAVDFIKRDRQSLGALVTTHKMDLFEACREQFDEIEPLSAAMGEVSSIYKRDGRLLGRACDPWSVGLSLDAFLPDKHWQTTRTEALILGAGGSAIALAWHLGRPEHGANRPSRILVANRSRPRLDHLRELSRSWAHGIPLDCHEVPRADMADGLLKDLPPGSLVVNATGLGKDAPGSPLTDRAIFPKNGLVWEFNYRGDLLFLQHARNQEKIRRLLIEDGWIYFIHGWTRVISDVFAVDIPTRGPRFDELSLIARTNR
jgi:shikimate 5-dehydrogenase